MFPYLCVLLFSSEILIQVFLQLLGWYGKSVQVTMCPESLQSTNLKKGEFKWKASVEILEAHGELPLMFQ